MNQQRKNEDRDEVLFAFHQACERPTAEEIIEWTERYPQFADDIRSHAAISRDWAASEDLPGEEADETMLARAYSNALDALYKAESKAKERTTAAVSASLPAAKSFHDVLAERGKETFELAHEMDIARSVLADLFNGWMLAPIRNRIIEAVTKSLAITRAGFDYALTFALQNPRFGHAKADGSPTVTARPCDEIIRESNMSDERKRHWLEED
jgi:hypothetical protein